jgi:hypothetical protein
MVNLNKKRKVLISVKIILIIYLIYIHIACGKDVYLNGSGDCITLAFGAVKTLFIPYLMLSIFSDFIRDKDKRSIFNIRIFFSIIFLFFLFNLQFLYRAESFSKENIEKNIFLYFYTEKHLGIVVSMIFSNLYFFITPNMNIALTGIVLFFSSFILFGKIIGNGFRNIARYYSKENRDKRKKVNQLILEKRRIKNQILEKEKNEKIEKKKSNQVEVAKKKAREEKIVKLRSEIKEKKKKKEEVKTSPIVGKQLNLQGLENNSLEVTPELDKVVGNPKETPPKEEVPKEQLYLDFKERGEK